MKKQLKVKLSLALYDVLVFLIVDLFLFVLYRGAGGLDWHGVMAQSGLSVVFIFGVRLLGKVYRQIWRYGGIQCYIRLLICDAFSFLCYLCLELALPVEKISFAKILAFCCMNTLGSLAIRMIYRYAYNVEVKIQGWVFYLDGC